MADRNLKQPSRRKRDVCADMFEWDIGTWMYALRFWEQRARDLTGKFGLEVGSRNGGMALFLALNGCRVICSDLNGPTVRARELHKAYGVSSLISYECVDATDIPFPRGHFDVVIFKSVLGGLGGERTLEAQRMAIGEIHRVLKKGGQCLFAENMAGSRMHGILREQLVPWGRNWRYFTVGEIEELLSGFNTVDLVYRGFIATLGRREWQRGLLHHMDQVVVPLLPNTCRYVALGVVTK